MQLNDPETVKVLFYHHEYQQLIKTNDGIWNQLSQRFDEYYDKNAGDDQSYETLLIEQELVSKYEWDEEMRIHDWIPDCYLCMNDELRCEC